MRWLLLLLLAGGCTARSTITQRITLPDGAWGGRVRWLVSSSKWVMDAEQRDARAKMYAHCQGPYDVVRQWDSMDAVVHGLFWSQMYVHRYVEFRCTPMKEIVDKVMAGIVPPEEPETSAAEPPLDATELAALPEPVTSPTGRRGRSR